MRYWFALPIFTLAFAAPISLTLMLIWPLWRPSGSIIMEASEFIAVALLTLGFSVLTAMLALKQKRSSRKSN